ncbi:MAG TPA: hypothetical protein VLJ86_18685 [Ramlibacter sp.]|nr:hypothetical protein [Ramlibacter sp.]
MNTKKSLGAHRIIGIATTLGAAALLAACGGGGGGGGSGGGGLVGASAAISESNKLVVAQDVASSAFAPMSASDALVGAQAADEQSVLRFTQRAVDQLPALLATALSANTLVGAASSATQPCTNSGFITVTADDADNSRTVSPGDRLTLVFANCVEPEGTATGSMTLQIASASYVSETQFNVSANVSYDAFTVASTGVTTGASGNLTLSVQSTGANAWTQSFSSASLAVTGTYGGQNRTRTLSSYAATATRAPDATFGYLTTYTANGALTSTALSSQTVSFATSTPFVVRFEDNYPSTGAMTITGANSSRLQVTAQSNTEVQLQLDANGDGTFEGSSTTAWSSLF